MFELGTIRAIVRDLPFLEYNIFQEDVAHTASDTHRHTKEHWKAVVDKLPDVMLSFNDDVLDFKGCMEFNRTAKTKLDFRKIPEEIRDYVKMFSLNNIDQGLKISTEHTKLNLLKPMLNRIYELCPYHTFACIREDDIIQSINELHSDSLNMTNESYRTIISLLDFLKIQLDLSTCANMKVLKRRQLYASDLLRGRVEQEHAPLIPKKMYNLLLNRFSDIMRDPNISTNYRMTAGMMLLDTQMGLRNSEIVAIKTDALNSVELLNGTTGDYLVYNSIKGAKGDREAEAIKTICTPLAKETFNYLLDLRKLIPGHENNQFLYIQDCPDSLNGKVFNADMFREKYKHLCTNYLLDIIDRNWKGIKKVKEYVATMKKPVKLCIPRIHSYRVTFASMLFMQNVNVDYINSIMGHSPNSRVNDAYLPDTKPAKVIRQSLNHLINNITNNL